MSYTSIMLVHGSKFIQTPVLSLQTGTKIADIARAIIDPRNLTIAAYEVAGPTLTQAPAYLRLQEIREISPIGMIVDSADELVGTDDVINLQKIIDINFNLIGLPVFDETKRRLGKVIDYTIETDGFVIQQISLSRGFLQSLSDSGLLIHRSQILEVTDTEIIVKTTAKKAAAQPVRESQVRNYANPFRSPSPQPESIDA